MLRACQKTRGILPCEVQFARFSSFFCCLLPCTNCVCVCGEKFKNKIKKKKKALQCSSSVLDSLRFAAFCSTAAFLSVTALRALVLRTCLPQCSFIARSGEAGSVAKGISKIAWCAAPWPAQAAVCRDVTPGGAAGRSLSSTSPGLSTREGIRQFWARLTGNSSHPPPSPSTHAHTPPEPHIPQVSF